MSQLDDPVAAPVAHELEDDALNSLRSLARMIAADAAPQSVAPPYWLRARAPDGHGYQETQSASFAERPPPARYSGNPVFSSVRGWAANMARTLPQLRNSPAVWLGLFLCLAALTALTLPTWFIKRELTRGPLPSSKEVFQADQGASSRPAISLPALPDVQMVQNAMADCDTAAAKDTESIHFLVIPIAPTAGVAEFWLPQGDAYDTYILLWSSVALQGLQVGSLALQRRSFAFAVADSATGSIRNWTALSGLSKITQDRAPRAEKFKIGFSIAGNGRGIQWTTDFERTKGSCYWIVPMFRT